MVQRKFIAKMSIQLRNVSQSYDSKVVLDEVNLNLATGKTHVLLGSSGSGKTSILKLITGLIAPDRGEILLSGKNISWFSQHQVAKQIGYVIQDGGLFPHLTAEQNITLASRIFHWSRQEKDKRLAELSDLVSLELSVLKRYPKELSGGQKQRVSLMRACFLNPSVMLLDEPLGALDPLIRSELQKELKIIFNRLAKTVLLVTHDLGEAAYFGHTISLLKSGHIIQHGSFSELVNHPKDPYVTEFISAQKRIYNSEEA